MSNNIPIILPNCPNAMTCLDHLSWNEIDDICRSGRARQEFALGATKTDVMRDGYEATYRIIGFGHDLIATGVMAATTWQLVDIYEEERPINLNGQESTSYSRSDVSRFLNGEFLHKCSDELQQVIKLVRKDTYLPDEESLIESAFYKFWLLSEWEVFGRQHLSEGKEGRWYEWYKQEGVDYRKENRSESRTTAYWWTRSPAYYGSGFFCLVGYNGTADYGSASTSYGIAPAFCI